MHLCRRAPFVGQKKWKIELSRWVSGLCVFRSLIDHEGPMQGSLINSRVDSHSGRHPAVVCLLVAGSGRRRVDFLSPSLSKLIETLEAQS